MPTQKQIAANRRNARRSTGPRSRAGKRRASQNARRHGLTITIAGHPAFTAQIEELARAIAGAAADDTMLQYARNLAATEIDLARIRHAKVALIERMRAFGAFKRPSLTMEEYFWGVVALAKGRADSWPEPPPIPAMPPSEPNRSAEAIRRALPDLVILDRYEQSVWLRRNRAVLELQVVASLRHLNQKG